MNKYKGRAVLPIVTAAILLCSVCVGFGPSPTDTRTVSEPVSESEPGSGMASKFQGDPDIVTKREDLPFQTGTETAVPGFTGNVYLGQMISNEEVYNFPQTNHIIFEPGARSSWHTHGGMVIMATGGIGYYQEEGKPAQILRPGDVVECAPGVNHWHGAAPDSWFSQMVIYDSHYSGGAGEGAMSGEVADEWYANLETEEYTGRTISEDNAFLFQRAAKAVSMKNFNGPVYLSSIIGSDNAAGAPEMHYVVFEPGVINNWHTHEGGQILIATDGIGYHQIEGQPVEVLYPGDVAFCPPGVKHWHGGSADTSFAHIAMNTNPGKPGVEWFDILSDEEYAQLPRVKESGDTVAETTAGSVRGSFHDGIYSYKGIPYAEAKERFVPASEVTPWDGVRDAMEYGAASPQGSFLGGPSSGGGDNNCQNLNIWTPGIHDGGKRPVMVWLHGGGFASGSANEAGYDGTNLSGYGDVVVVGVNHRLNITGFLDLSDYGEKYRYSANVGILDIIDALRWIQDNIEAFGGDPQNVTVFGQSGGGAKVLALMGTPYAKGLFRKGIIQSGATPTVGETFHSLEVSKRLTELVLKNLDISKDNIEEIQSIPYSELSAAGDAALAQAAQEYRIAAPLAEGYGTEWEPVIEGDFFPTEVLTENGGFAESGKDIPLLIGSNLNEWTTFHFDSDSTEDTVSAELAAAFAAAYPGKPESEAAHVDTLIRPSIRRIMVQKANQGGAPVYGYVFTYEGAGSSYHGAELPLIFRNDGMFGSGGSEEMKDTMADLWVSFARNGVPSADSVPKWEPFTRDSGATMILDETSYMAYRHDEELMKILAPEYDD